MERQKVVDFYKELNVVLDELAKKHGFASARVRHMSYNETEIVGRVVVVVNQLIS